MTRRSVTVAGAVLFVLAIAWNALELRGEVNDPDRPSVTERVGFADYRDTVVTPTRDLWLEGENPYDHDSYLSRHPGHQEFNLYSPGWLLLATPFAFADYEVGEVLYGVVLVALALVLARLILPTLGWPASPGMVLAGGAVVMLTAPGQSTMYFGQAAFLLAVGLVLAVRYRVSRPWLAGTGLALCLLKPQTGVPLAILLGAGWGAWRAVGRGVVLSVALALLPLVTAVRAAGGLGDFLQSVVDNAEYSTEHYGGAGDLLMSRIDAGAALTQLAEIDVTTMVSAIVFVVVLGLAVVVLRRLGAGVGAPVDPEPRAVMVTTLAVLVGTVHFVPDTTMLLWPLALVGVAVARSRVGDLRAWAVVALIAAVPILHLSRVDDVLERVGVGERWRVALDGTALLLALAGAIVLALRQSSPSASSRLDWSDGSDEMSRRSVVPK